MTRVNLILVFLVVLCALGIVSSQHRARKLFLALQNEQDTTKQLEIEFGQLQLEQSTWAMHERIEQIASGKLHMRVPPSSRTQIVPPLNTLRLQP